MTAPRFGLQLLLGTAIFVVITVFEQLPVIGWLGAFASLLAWIWLGGEVRRAGGAALEAGILGFVTGLVGAVTGWLAQLGTLFGPDTAGMARVGAGFGVVGAAIFIVAWPILGALVCGGTAAIRARGYAPER